MQLLNRLTIEHVGLGSPGHVLDMPGVDHSDFKAVLFQHIVKTEPVDAR